MDREKIIASIDIGTNSIILLLVKYTVTGKFIPLNEYIAITRLGEGLNERNLLSEKAMQRSVDAVAEMQEISLKEGAEHIILTAGCGMKKAENKSQFLLKCSQKLGVYPQLLSGDEEARLSFNGATSGINNYNPTLLIDVGGGSTEIVYGTKQNIVGLHSLPLGCVVTNDMFEIGTNFGLFKSRAVKAYIKSVLQEIHECVDEWLVNTSPTILVSGGSATTFAAIMKKQILFDRNDVNETVVSRKELSLELKRQFKMTPKERENIVGMEKGRAEVLPAGLYILNRILKELHFETFEITANGLRMGVVQYFINNGPKI